MLPPSSPRAAPRRRSRRQRASQKYSQGPARGWLVQGGFRRGGRKAEILVRVLALGGPPVGNTLIFCHAQAAGLCRDLYPVGRIVPGHTPGGCGRATVLCRVLSLPVRRGNPLRIQLLERDASAQQAPVD